jgi:uncharacterized protein YecT (DUF1311 family)
MALTLILGDQLHREWLEASPLQLRAGQPVLPVSLEVPFWRRLATELKADLEAGHPGQGSGLQVAEIADRGFEQLLGALLLGSVLVSPLGLAAAKAAAETLQQSERQLSQFPFRPNCAGNNQEIVACLWQRRNQADLKLKALLRSPALLEQWRSSRRQLCAKAAAKAEGGSLYPLVALGCENSLNNTLIEQISRPLERH